MSMDPIELSKLVMRGETKKQSESIVFSTGIDRLDQAFRPLWIQGGLFEWGLPLGRNGRPLLLEFLSGWQGALVWVYGFEDLKLQASAWQARGLNLDKTYFIESRDPLVDLRPLFLDRVFPIVILDGVKKLRSSDFSFLAGQARKNQIVIFVIRDFFLSMSKGNPFARGRCNIDYDEKKKAYRVNLVKGSKQEKFLLKVEELRKWERS